MYTRCPSCRSEISFDPPPNKDSLPENYRHRIKCPSCGVTIGVKINQNPQILSQPIGRPQLAAPPGSRPAQRQSAQRPNSGYYTPKNPYTPPPKTNNYGAQRGYAQPNPAPYSAPVPQEQPKSNAKSKSAQSQKTKAQTKKQTKADTRLAKKSGASRNIMMMIFSLVFIVFSAVTYLVSQGILSVPDSFGWLKSSTYNVLFSGISVWQTICTDFEGFKLIAELLGPLGTFATIVPLLLFTLSCINFIVAFVSLCGRKYGRVFNLLFSTIIGGLAVTALFAPYFIIGVESTDVLGYLVDVIGSGAYIAIAGAAWGALQFLFSVIFLKSMKRKQVADVDTKKGAKGNSKSNAKKQPQKKNSKGRR